MTCSPRLFVLSAMSRRSFHDFIILKWHFVSRNHLGLIQEGQPFFAQRAFGGRFYDCCLQIRQKVFSFSTTLRSGHSARLQNPPEGTPRKENVQMGECAQRAKCPKMTGEGRGGESAFLPVASWDVPLRQRAGSARTFCAD